MTQLQGPGFTFTDTRRQGFVRPAGLSDRYAHIEPEIDHTDPIMAFRRDPLTFIQTRGYLASVAADETELQAKYASYTDLIDVDFPMKYGAWSDVRQKAMRLLHEGRVHVNDLAPDRIYATVEGDHGTYDTMIYKGGAMGGLGGGQSITNWHCGCEWGNWAFKRRFSYVGRLCSHGYAAYLKMQSKYLKENPSHFRPQQYSPGEASPYWSLTSARTAGVVDDYKTWLKDFGKSPEPSSIADFISTSDEEELTPEQVEELYDYIHEHPDEAPERDFDTDYTFDADKVYKESDLLRTTPQGLQPSLRQVPEGDEGHFVDVTKDERETTGPDQIVHFSTLSPQMVASLHQGAGSGRAISPDQMRGAPAPPPMPTTGAPNTPSGKFNPYIQQTYGTPAPGTPAQPTPAPGTPAQPAAPVSATAPAPGSAPGTPIKPAPDLSPETVKNTATGYGTGAGQGGAFGTGQGFGGAGYQGQGGGAGNWLRSQETTGIDRGQNYTVKPGETLNDIANRFGPGVNAKDLAQASGIKDINMIRPGDVIKAPGGTGPGGGPGGTVGVPKNSPAIMPQAPTAEQPAAGEAPVPGYVPPGGRSGVPGVNSGQYAGQSSTPSTTAPPPPAGGKLPSDATFTALSQAGNALNDQGQPKTSSYAYLLHHAADDNDDDERRPNTGEAAADLDRLRDLCDEDPSEHYQDMRDYNDQVADLVDSLEDAGVMASPFVASLHTAEDTNDGKANYQGRSVPNWADRDYAGSGPSPKDWISDSASYVEDHERKDMSAVNDLGDEDIIKFNDSRSAPPQGPRHGWRYHYADDSDDSGGYFNPTSQPTSADWEAGSGQDFMDELSNQVNQVSPQLPGKGGGGGEAGEAAEGGEAAEAAEAIPLVIARRGRGPATQVRYDPGARQQLRASHQTYGSLPDDFGNNGDPTPADYGEPMASPTGSDVVANFHRSGAAADIMNQAPGGGRDDDIAAHARAFLRTAGRKYTYEEQRELEAEFHPRGARNLPTDAELEGTHYLLDF